MTSQVVLDHLEVGKFQLDSLRYLRMAGENRIRENKRGVI